MLAQSRLAGLVKNGVLPVLETADNKVYVGSNSLQML